jgi:serine/threonine-protein kinase SRPK3
MMQPADLFHICDKENEVLNNAHHLAAMIALLGPPPQEFLDRSPESMKYWDENGWYTPFSLRYSLLSRTLLFM